MATVKQESYSKVTVVNQGCKISIGEQWEISHLSFLN